MKQEEAIKRAPVPEARMRLQEATAKPTNPTPTSTTATFKAPRKQTQTAKFPPKTYYDPSKDPFASDDLPAAVSVDPRKKVAEAVSTNPFGDIDDADVPVAEDRKALDSNLNPFE